MFLIDTVVYTFWWLVVTSLRLIQWCVLAVAPTWIVETEVKNLFKSWNVRLTNGKENAGNFDKDKCSVEMVVHDRRMYKRIAHDDSFALGEGYMEGLFDCDDIPELITQLLLHSSYKTTPLIPLYVKLDLARNQQTRTKAFKVIDEHYNLGNDLYEKMLDPTMNYSCAYWKEGTTTLEEAQINKMDLIARKLQLKPGMKVLDIGSGFGATAKYLAQTYGVSVVGYNISKEQVAWARKSCEGLDVEFRMEDYRNASGEYDRIYSIGFFEHVGVRNYRHFYKVCERCLKHDGLFLLHSITIKDHTQPRTNRWLNKYIFPGGELPYGEDYFVYSDGIFVVEDVHNFGYNYKLTLLEWHKNFTAHWKELEQKYGAYNDGKFKRMWDFYLQFCAGLFGARVITVFQVVYSKKGVKGGYASVR